MKIPPYLIVSLPHSRNTFLTPLPPTSHLDDIRFQNSLGPPSAVSVRGREALERFFPAWKVLKVCSKKYIKNYPFFGAIYSIIIIPQTLLWFGQLEAIFCNISKTVIIMLKK